MCRRTYADASRRRHTYARRQTQMHAKFFSYIPCPSCYMFRPWVSLPVNPCPTLVAFQDPEIQLALNWWFLKPCRPNYTVLRTSVSLGGLPWFLDMSYWEVLGVWWSLSHVDSFHFTLDSTVEGPQLQTHERRHTRTYTDVCTRTQTHADNHKANCIWCVGGHASRH